MQQQILAQQQAAARQRQVLMQQQYSGGMPNMQMNMHAMNPNQMTAAQFAMRHGNAPGLARTVPLPQHLAQQQQIAQENVNQQQAQHQVY